MLRCLKAVLVAAVFIHWAVAVYAFVSLRALPSSQLTWLSLLLGVPLAVVAFLLLFRWFDGLPRKSALVVILGIALAVRALWIVAIRNEPVSDFAIYHEFAQALLSGKGYALTGPVGLEDLPQYLGVHHSLPYQTALRAPGTAFFAAALFAVFGDHVLIFKLANLVMGTATVGLIYLLMFESGFEAIAGRAAILWALYPPAIAATALLGSETLFTFLLVLLAYGFTRVPDDRTWKFLLLGVLAAAAALVRPMHIIFVVACATALLFDHDIASAAAKTGLFVIGLAVGLSPWAVRNARLFHAFIPVCTMEGNFFGRHTAYLLVDDNHPITDPKFLAWQSLDSESERARAGYRLALGNIVERIRRGPLFLIRSQKRSWLSAFAADDELLTWSLLRSYLAAQSPGTPLAVIGVTFRALCAVTNTVYLTILSFALVSVWRSKRTMKFSAGVAFLGFFYFLSFIALSLVQSMPRYHFSMMPWVIMLAAFAVPVWARRD